jgi:hypothetical protein
MAKIIPITEHYQHFLAEMKESFWGDVYGETRLAWKRLLEAGFGAAARSLRRARAYQRRAHRRQPYRNGYYERDFVTRWARSGCALPAPGEKVFCRARSNRFSGGLRMLPC